LSSKYSPAGEAENNDFNHFVLCWVSIREFYHPLINGCIVAYSGENLCVCSKLKFT
jgi:hypothetical protein